MPEYASRAGAYAALCIQNYLNEVRELSALSSGATPEEIGGSTYLFFFENALNEIVQLKSSGASNPEIGNAAIRFIRDYVGSVNLSYAMSRAVHPEELRDFDSFSLRLRQIEFLEENPDIERMKQIVEPEFALEAF